MYQPIFELFLKFNGPVHNLLFELCTGQKQFNEIYLQLRFKMRARFVSSVFCIFPKLHFPFFNIKKAHKY